MKKISTGVLLIVLGIVLTSGGAYLLKDKIEFYMHSSQAEGTVIDVETSRTKSTTYYHPVISFQAEDGQSYNFKSETGTSAALDFNIGDKLPIRYIKETPKVAKRDNFLDIWALPLALLVAGIVIVLSGGFSVYNIRRPKAS